MKNVFHCYKTTYNFILIYIIRLLQIKQFSTELNLKIAKQSLRYGMYCNSVKRRKPDTGNIMPNHPQLLQLQWPAVLQSRIMKQVNFFENYERQRKNYFKFFECQDLKYWQIHFVAVVTFHPVLIVNTCFITFSQTTIPL